MYIAKIMGVDSLQASASEGINYIMKKNILILKVLLPSVVSFALIRIVEIPFSFYPLSFALVIGIVNWNIHKYKPLLGIFLSIWVSYLTFLIAYSSMLLVGYLTKELFKNAFNDETIGIITFSISPYIIAPLLVFWGYSFIFNISKTKLTKTIIFVSIMLINLQYYFFYSQGLNQNSINSFTGWQVIMIIALQLIITQKINANKS